MQMYSVPASTNEKEKIVGGLLTLNQVLWVGSGALVFFLTSLLLLSSLKVGALFLGLILGAPFVAFGLVKIQEVSLMTYIKRKRAFKKLTKQLPKKRSDFTW